MDQTSTVQSEVLDSETRSALEEGLRMADADPRRWTPEEVTADAKKWPRNGAKN
jgi:hypothetical protein